MRQNQLFFLILFMSFSLSGFSQIDIRNKIEAWYKTARFSVADIDKNKKLSKEEMANFADDFIFYFNKDNFNFADADKNGLLDSAEIENKWESERSLRDIFEKQKIRSLNTNYLSLPIADLKYLRQNPELIAELMKNAYWMTDNPFLTSELLKKKRLITEDAGIMAALNHNLYWLARNPQIAEKIYGYCNPEALSPQITLWRELHKKFLRDNKKALSVLYDIESGK
ncbi:MAG: hypothetical protein K1X92_10380 [Bacteroidia bacterium]|nr:hypothetical protein [Bacteroidia bacterium]